MADQNSKETAPSHSAGTRQGEEIKDADGKEPGRHDADSTHADRPAGTSTSRDSTAINPDDVESVTDSPKMPPA
ncbi:MAG: hypothetical protein WBP93_06075 [Pyrinomonadaceae bacterium]